MRCPVVIGARGEVTILPGLSPGSWRSRGTQPFYGKVPLCQAATTAGSDVPAQRVWAQVPAPALEPAVLPGSGVFPATPPLAGGAAAGPTSPGTCRQNQARRGGTCTAEGARRQRARAAQAVPRSKVAAARGHAARIFCPALVRAAGMRRTGAEGGPHPGMLLRPGVPPGGPPSVGSRTQVGLPWHFPRPLPAQPGV